MSKIDLDKWGEVEKLEKEKREEGDFYKFQEGANKLRILTDFFGVNTIRRGNEFAGQVTAKNQAIEGDQVTFKGWAWAIIRETGELKIVQLSKTLLLAVYSLKKDSDYQFDGYPMPYDITINATGAGTKEVKYSVTPARQNSEVTEEEMAQLVKKKSIPDIIKAIQDKQDGNKPDTEIEYPENTAKGVPFE